ncbi:MAG: hypothetical protein WC249_04115 [Patescibacteria group bacterium]|jgi:hypothetical protein
MAKELNPDLLDIVSGDSRPKDYKHYTGERIAQMEAKEEEKTKRELEKTRNEIANLDSDNEKKQQLQNEEEKLASKLEKQKHASLYLKEIKTNINFIHQWFGKKDVPDSLILKGVINGQRVEIDVTPGKDWERDHQEYFMVTPEKNPELFIFNGKIDEKNISLEKSAELFTKYREVASKRDDYWELSRA